MPNLNLCTFIGHVGRDAEQTFTSNGTAVLKFSLAAVSGYGEKKKTTWLNVTKWKPPDWMAKEITKGSLVYVAGEIELREYDKRDGSGNGYSLDLNAREVLPLNPKGDGGGVVSMPRQAQASSPYAPGVDDDSIPF
jgi:single-strand DNA-binding protein